MKTLFPKIIFFILISLSHSSFLKAQNSEPPIRWGKISEEELAITACDFEKNAGAIILCDYGQLSAFADQPVKLNRHKRIKILNEEGTGAADVKIPFYAKNNYEAIVEIEAQTVSVNESGTLVNLPVQKDQIFVRDIDKSWNELIITFPNAKPGAILDLKYTLISRDVYHLSPWYFQAELPTLHSELVVDVAGTRTYNAVAHGSLLMKKASLNDNPNRWILKNVPSLREEPYVWNYEDYAENIEFQLSSQGGLALVRDQITYKEVTVTWDMLVKDFLASPEIEKFMSKYNLAQKIIDKLNLLGKPDEEKIKALFHYVNQNYKWNKELRIFPEQNIKELLDSKQGNSAELNLLLTLLIKEFGIRAYPALLSTKDKGIVSKDIISFRQFNNLVCVVKLKEKTLILDARADNHPYDLLEVMNLNKDVFVLDEAHAHWIEIKPALNSIRTVYINLDMNKTSEEKAGDISLRYEGYHAISKREEILEQGEEKFIKELQYAEQIKLIQTKIENKDDPYQSLLIKSDFQDLHEWNEDIIYFNPFYVNFYEENLLKSDERFFPVDFIFPDKDYFVAQVKIPAGYEVLELPKELQIKLPNNGGSYICSFTQKEDVIQINSRVILTKAVFPVEEYRHLKEFFDQIRAKHAEQIVLKKKP